MNRTRSGGLFATRLDRVIPLCETFPHKRFSDCAQESKIPEWKAALHRELLFPVSSIQVFANEDGKGFGEVTAEVGDRMMLGGLQSLCDEIAETMGGGLYGTVNIDFSGSCALFEMMVEF